MLTCDKLFLQHQKPLYKFLLFNLYFNKEMAEDFLHDLFIKIRKAFENGNYVEEGKFKQWALWVARNMINDYYRLKKNTMINPVTNESYFYLFNDNKETTPSREDEIIKEEEFNWFLEGITRAIETLDEKQRTIFLMRVLEDKSFKEIIKITGDGQNTEIGRYRYARLNIKKRLIEYKIAI